MGTPSSKVKILFSSYAGSPLFHYRVEVNDKTLLNPPGLFVDKSSTIVITPIKDNAVEGASVTLESFPGNVDLAVNVIRTDDAPGFKAIYTVNNPNNHNAIFYYPNDMYHHRYNIHMVHTNIKSVNPSMVITKDPEMSVYATDAVNGDPVSPEMVLPLSGKCGVYHVILDEVSGDLRIEMVASGNNCEKHTYIEPL
jgi:hypothetical protein